MPDVAELTRSIVIQHPALRDFPDDIREELWGVLSGFDRRARNILLILLEGGSEREAARAVGITRQTIYNWKDKDPAFKEAVALFGDFGVSVFESELRRRALAGVADKHSMRALELALKAKAPEYRDKQALNITLRAEAEGAAATFVGGWGSNDDSAGYLPSPADES